MKPHLKLLVAGILVPLAGAVLGGCSAGAPAPQTEASPSVASLCNPARCGEHPLVRENECSNGSYAGVASCVKNPGDNGCGWLVSDCSSGG